MSPHEEDMTPSPLLRIHLRTASIPWRLTYAWVACIGAVYALGVSHLWDYRFQLLGLVGLSDVVWGTWGWLATARTATSIAPPAIRWPYARAHAPWTRVRTWLPPGAISTGVGTLILAVFIISSLGTHTAWLTALALGGSIGLWAWSHISPTGVSWGLPLYGWGLPLWAGGYIFGHGDGRLAAAAATLVVSYWALRCRAWKRALLGGLALTLWLGISMRHLPDSVMGLTTLMWLISLFAQRPSVGVEVLWGLTLSLFALSTTW